MNIYYIDYSTDSLYGFVKPFFNPLYLNDINKVIHIFLYNKVTALTTEEFLRIYENEFLNIKDFLDSFDEDEDEDETDLDILLATLKDEDITFLKEKQLEFREQTKELKNWPLSQFVFSCIYQLLIAYCCPYQERVRNVLLEKNWFTNEAKKIRQLLEDSSSNNLSDEEIIVLCERMVLLENSWIKEELLEAEKRIATCPSYFWGRVISSIFLGQGNKKLSFEVLELFLAFAQRHPGFTREYPEFQKEFISILNSTFFNEDIKKLETYTFFLFIIAPLFELLGISSVKTRLAFINYPETKNREVVTNLLNKSQEKEAIKGENITINRETNK